MTEAIRLPELSIRKLTLANGLDVMALRYGSLPIVAVNLWYHVGSKNEERTQKGFAHLFEHLMFEGSEHYPGDYFKPLQRLGASVNGSTSADRTNYFVDLPAAHAETVVAMESDRMANFLPALSDEKLRVQKDVVKNEYRQNYANRPYGQVGRILGEAMYPPEHPYSWPTIGAMEDVERAARDDVAEFFRRYYVPSNASLAIVGDLDEDEAHALAERYFGGIPAGSPPPPVWWVGPSHRRDPIQITLRDRVELDRVYLSWPSVRQFAPEDAALSLLADILGRGKASRLYSALVMREQIAQDVSAYQSGREIAGTFGVVATMRPGVDPGRARERIERALSDLAEEGPEPGEMERAKNGRLAGFVFALDNVGGFGGVADRLNAYNTYLGDPARITSDFSRYQEVSAESVREAARGLLSSGWPTPLVALTVTGGSKATVAPPLDRSTRPAPTRAKPYRAPVPEVRILACGVPLWSIPRPELPIVAGSIVIRAGASAHRADRSGLADLTADVLDEGTRSRSALDLALEVEGLGASLSSSCGWDGSYVGFQCLEPHLGRMLDLAAELLLEPTFPEEEFARLKAQGLAALRAARDSAEGVAHRTFLRVLYPGDHPYARPTDGDEATVSALARSDLVDFHGSHYRPDASAVIVSGRFDPDRLADLIDDRLCSWTGAAARRLAIVDPALVDRPRIVLVARPGSTQAAIRVGHPGIAWGDPDYDRLILFNQILGGQFTSRLNAKLREERGYTYGVRSGFDARVGAGPFSIVSSIQADRLADALEELRGEVNGILGDRRPTTNEMDEARRGLIEGQSRHFENPSALVSRYAALFVHDLPIDHHARWAERLEAIDADRMLEAARAKIRPDRFTYVVVADPEVVAGPLERLGWAEVERVEAGR